MPCCYSQLIITSKKFIRICKHKTTVIIRLAVCFCLSLDSEGAIKDIRRSICLLVWLLSSNKDLVFSGGDVPLGIIEHHLFCCHSKGHLRAVRKYHNSRVEILYDVHQQILTGRSERFFQLQLAVSLEQCQCLSMICIPEQPGNQQVHNWTHYDSIMSSI